MTLKNKIILIFGVLFIAFGSIQVAINRLFILPSFVNLENDEAIRNLKRAGEAVNDEISHLDTLCHDWSAWDDTYEFMETASQEYMLGNLSAESFRTANLDLIYYLDTAGDVYWGNTYDPENGEEITLSGFSRDDGALLRDIFRFDRAASEFDPYTAETGVMITEKGPLMLAGRQILTSDHEGPPRGTIIMGKFMTASMIERLKEETKADFRIYVNNPETDSDLKKIMARITPSSPYVIKENPDKIYMYDSFYSMQGAPAFLIETVFPREITRQGIKTVRYSLFFLMAAGAAILLVTLILIKNVIITPIVTLSRHISRVEEGNYKVRTGLKRKDAIGRLAASFDKMVAKIEAQTEQLESLSSTDGLTGIHNRRFFDTALSKEWKRTGRKRQDHLSAIMCDVDFFKLYNDRYGHQIGDNCLKTIAGTIRRSLKRPTDFVARYGGEEFIVLLPDTSPEGAEHVAEEIRRNVQDLKIEHEASGAGGHVTLSLGVSSIVPSKDCSPGDLIEAADKALYQSKQNGRNRVVFRAV